MVTSVFTYSVQAMVSPFVCIAKWIDREESIETFHFQQAAVKNAHQCLQRKIAFGLCKKKNHFCNYQIFRFCNSVRTQACKITDLSTTAAVQLVANQTGNTVDHSDPDPDGIENQKYFRMMLFPRGSISSSNERRKNGTLT